MKEQFVKTMIDTMKTEYARIKKEYNRLAEEQGMYFEIISNFDNMDDLLYYSNEKENDAKYQDAMEMMHITNDMLNEVEDQFKALDKIFNAIDDYHNESRFE